MAQELDSARVAGVPPAELLELLLRESEARHQHLCPRQVLGARLALHGLLQLGLVGPDDYLPRFRNRDKRLLTIVETDGCGADGISVATDCSVGRRTLRLMDYGKVAATLIDCRTRRAIRVAPTAASRELAISYAPHAQSRWHAYRDAYRIIPDAELVIAQVVELVRPISDVVSRPEARAICVVCREEIINEREVIRGSQTLCLSCAGDSYYQLSD